MSTTGKITDGATTVTASADGKLTSRAVPTMSGIVQSLTARLWLDGAGTCNWRGVIYSSSGDSPTNLLAVTDDGAFTNTSEQEVTLNFTGANKILLTAGTTYWIGVHLQDPGTVSWVMSKDATADMRITNADDVWTGGAANPHSVDKTSLSGPIDCYVTFNPTSAGFF